MEIHGDFEVLLGKSAQAIRNANRKIREVLATRGSLNCGKGFVLLSDSKELILNLKTLFELAGICDKGGNLQKKTQTQQKISNVKAEDEAKVYSEEV